MYPVTLRLILFKNVLTKGSMEISMYPVILRLIQKFFTKRVHGNFHGNFHVPVVVQFLPWNNLFLNWDKIV